MTHQEFGRILGGSAEELEKSYKAFKAISPDRDLLPSENASPAHANQRTIERPVSVTGPGTFFGKANSTLTLEPTNMEGWWFDRADQPDSLPVKVSIRNVWTTGQIVSNIVLRSGPPHNYIRLVEHIIALRYGCDVDNLMIRIDSGDPPLFDQGSLDIIEALEQAGRHEYQHPNRYFTVKEKVTLGWDDNKFLIIEPMTPGHPSLELDCAVQFKSAIRKQRIRFPVNYTLFKEGSVARTNTTFTKMLFCKTIGRLFADIRHLGYTKDNVLIAGKFKYFNKPRLLHNGKSLEAVWHRAVLDLLAAVALIEEGRFLGKITSYKAGHAMDVEMIRLLYANNLLTEVDVSGRPIDTAPSLPTPEEVKADISE